MSEASKQYFDFSAFIKYFTFNGCIVYIQIHTFMHVLCRARRASNFSTNFGGWTIGDGRDGGPKTMRQSLKGKVSAICYLRHILYILIKPLTIIHHCYLFFLFFNFKRRRD